MPYVFIAQPTGALPLARGSSPLIARRTTKPKLEAECKLWYSAWIKGDSCMAVGVLLQGNSADDFSQNGNGFDAPTSDIDWPNVSDTGAPHLSVWLR